METPRRQGLSEVIARHLAVGIEQGKWGSRLPGGRALAVELGVSRPTLYAALARLKASGRLAGGPRQLARLPSSADQPRVASRPDKLVLLSPYALDELSTTPALLAARLGALGAERGMRLEFIRLPRADLGASARRLATLVAQRPRAAWVLYRCSPEIQERLARLGVPVVVIGSSPEALRLGAADADHAAAARHLAGRLEVLGHDWRNIRLLSPSQTLHGDRLAIESLLKAGARAPAIIGDDADAAAARVGQFVAEGATALVTFRANHALTAVSQVWRMGLRCPEDISIVSLADSQALAQLRPEVSRYRIATDRLFRIVRIALDNALSANPAPGRSRKVLPEFIAGQTLGKPARR